MVGQVVNKGYHTHVGEQLAMQTPNDTTPAPVLTPNASMTSGAGPSEVPIHHVAHLDGYADPIKLGFALSVTFVVGVLQVRTRDNDKSLEYIFDIFWKNKFLKKMVFGKKRFDLLLSRYRSP